MHADSIEMLELLFNATTIGITFIGSKEDFSKFIEKNLPEDLVHYLYANEYAISTEEKNILIIKVDELDGYCRVMYKSNVEKDDTFDISLYLLTMMIKNNTAVRLAKAAKDISSLLKSKEEADEKQVRTDEDDLDFDYV